MQRPLWIVIEGADAAGKTRFAAALQEKIKQAGSEAVLVHTPSSLVSGQFASAAIGKSGVAGQAWAGRVHSNTPTYARALYFLADMAAVFEQVIEPALMAGRHVISDRWLPSTLIYHRAVLKKQSMDERSIEFSVSALSNFYDSYHFLRSSHYLVVDTPLDVRLRRLAVKHELARARQEAWRPDWYEAQPEHFHRYIGEQFRDIAIDRDWDIVDGAGVKVESEAERIARGLNWQGVRGA